MINLRSTTKTTNMRKTISSLSILSLFILLIATSCKKKCSVDIEDKNRGAIIQNAVFYPSSGFMTGNMGGDYVINAAHKYAQSIQGSLNGGSKSYVNYSNYTILCCPTYGSCNASYDREVIIDNSLQTVVYKIVVTQCTECGDSPGTENYVLVPTFPASYAVSYDVSYIDK